MSWLALPWFVLTTTGSPAQMSAVMAAVFIPFALLGIPSGAVVTRLGPRRTMLICDLARAPIIAAIPILHSQGALPFSLLLALVFASGTFWAPHFASQRLILPDLLGEDQVAVTRGNALFVGVTRLSGLLGPAAAGVLIGLIGASNILLLDAATYLASFAIVLVAVPVARRPHSQAPSEGLFAGLSYLLRDQLLRRITTIMGATELTMQALFAAVPIMVFVRFDERPALAGVLLGAWGAGSVLGSIAATWLARRDALTVGALGTLGQALPLWLLVLHLPAAAIAGALLASGGLNAVANAPLNAAATLRIPEALRAKAMLALLTVTGLAGPLGLLVAGPVAEWLGLDVLFGGIAALATLAAASFLAFATRHAARLRHHRLLRSYPGG